MTDRRPSFLSSYLRFASEVIEDKPWRLFPLWLVIGAGCGFASARFMPTAFWGDDNWEVSVAVYSGFLAFNGLLLALGWSAFSKIYEIATAGDFAEFLKRNDLLRPHLFFIDHVHLTLVLAALISGTGVVTTLVSLGLVYDQVILGATIAVSINALAKAMSAIRVMNDLVWERAHYQEQERPQLRSIDGSKGAAE